MNRTLFTFKYLLLAVLIICSFASEAQSVVLMKWTSSVGGQTFTTPSGNLVLRQSIGQSSPIGHFQSATTHLLQGFQYLSLIEGSPQLSLSELIILPNPSSGEVRLRWSEEIYEKIEVTVLNLNGKIVAENSISRMGRTSSLFQVNELIDGVYIIQASGSATELSSSYLIIQK